VKENHRDTAQATLSALFDEMNSIPQASATMKWLVSILALITATGAALGQTNRWVPKKMSLEDCIEVALKHNFDVQIQRYNPELNLYALKAQYGAYDPNFSLSGEHDYTQLPGGLDAQGRSFQGTEASSDSFNAGLQGLLPSGLTYNLGWSLADRTTTRSATFAGTNAVTFFDTNTFAPTTFFTTNAASPGFSSEIFQGNGNALALTLRQPLLKNFWIDSVRLQILVDKSNLRISELDLRNQIMTTVTAVEKAYYDLIYDQENIKVQQKAVELAERQLSENRKRVEVGAMAPLDEKQAASQAAQSRADLLTALGTEETQQRVLKNLLSDDYSKWQDTAIQPDQTLAALPQKFDLHESWQKGLTQRPDLLKQKRLLEQAGYQVRFNRNQLFPELDLIGSAGLNSSSSTYGGYQDQLTRADNPFYTIGGQISFPLSQTAARNNYKFAKAKKAQTELQLNQTVQNALIAIENAISVVNTDFQTVSARREARIYAEDALAAEQKKLESGKSTSFVVLQLTKDLTTARSAEIRALADYNQALADEAFQEGSSLERRHVSLEWK
jgi:outer membrane protein TolC